MLIKKCTASDINSLIDIVKSVNQIYGIDTISTGWRERHIALIEDFIDSPYGNIVMAIEENKILGFCVQTFNATSTRWMLNICYIVNSGATNQFNASKIGGPLMDKMIELAELKHKFEFFYVVRDSGRKRLNMTLAMMAYAAHYTVEDIEILPPFTVTKYPKIAEAILGHINGTNKKTIVVRRAYRHEQHNQIQS